MNSTSQPSADDPATQGAPAIDGHRVAHGEPIEGVHALSIPPLGGFVVVLGLWITFRAAQGVAYMTWFSAPNLVEAYTYLLSRDADTFAGAAAVMHAVIAALVCLAQLVLLYLFGTRSRWFRSAYLAIAGVTIGWAILDVLLVRPFGIGPTASFGGLALPDPNSLGDLAEAGIEIAGRTIGCGLWVPYVALSRRVRRTFVV